MENTYRSILTVVTLAIFTVSTVEAEDYLYETNNGTITITGYIGPGSDVAIPDAINGFPVTRIGDRAFQYYSLTSVSIPKSVTSIGGSAFGFCTSLAAITVDPLNVFYSSLDGVLFNKNQTVIIQCPAGKTGSYELPNSVISVGDSAFRRCTGLTSVTIGHSVTSIGGVAFSGCTSLTNVTIGRSVTRIGVETFSVCTGLTSVTIPNKVASIAFAAFAGCTGLTNVTIGDSVASIEGYAFCGCSGLTTIAIPNSVTSIGGWALSYCSNLLGVYFMGNAPVITYQPLFADATNATIYYLPGATGWTNTYADRPTVPWLLPHPVILTTAPNFGLQTNAFGFRISWATNVPVVVEASTTLANPTWSPVSTNALSSGWTYFSEAEWTNYPARFYRVRQR